MHYIAFWKSWVKNISIDLDQCKKLEEEAKQLRPLPEKMEKCRQLEAKLNGEKHQLEGKGDKSFFANVPIY